MTFTFDTGVPDANDNPSDDQPDMLINNVSVDGIWVVDHVGFNASNGGTHKQINFKSKNAGGAQTDPASIVYTGNGTASTVAQLFFRNQSVILPLSTTRSFAFCDNAGTVLGSQSFNVSGVVRNSAGVFTVTLAANATSSASYGVVISSGLSFVGGSPMFADYTITNTTTFVLRFWLNSGASVVAADPATFTFTVIQL